MPYVEHQIKKLYYNIGELAEEFSVSPSCIRYWSNLLNLGRHRTKRNWRLYNIEDVEKLKILRGLINEGYSLKGALAKVSDNACF